MKGGRLQRWFAVPANWVLLFLQEGKKKRKRFEQSSNGGVVAADKFLINHETIEMRKKRASRTEQQRRNVY